MVKRSNVKLLVTFSYFFFGFCFTAVVAQPIIFPLNQSANQITNRASRFPLSFKPSDAKDSTGDLAWRIQDLLLAIANKRCYTSRILMLWMQGINLCIFFPVDAHYRPNSGKRLRARESTSQSCLRDGKIWYLGNTRCRHTSYVGMGWRWTERHSQQLARGPLEWQKLRTPHDDFSLSMTASSRYPPLPSYCTFIIQYE